MTRVLNILSDTNVGGAGRVILNYLRYSDTSRFETLVVLPRGGLLKSPLEEAGARVLEVEGIADRSFHRNDVRLLKGLLRREKPDLVHTHGCLSGRIAAKACRIPVVYSRHSAFPVPGKLRYPPGRWINKLVNEHYADQIIAVSPAARDNLVQGGVSPKKITVVMNGVAPMPAAADEERKAALAELSIPEEAVVFGIIARLEEYKGHLDLVEAVRQLKERGKGERFVVLVAGTGPFEKTLARAVEETGTEDVIRLLGFRSDVNRLLSLMDVQLNCSYGTEATSLALLEGMSAALASVVSDYGGNPWVVQDGVNGLVYPTRDADALARAMERLMDDLDECAQMGRRARTIYEERFTGEAFARNIENIYLNTLKGAQ